MQINGFEIEQYNVHNIPEGARYHTCPLCSHTRKKKEQKCLNLHWDNGLAKCSHCGEVVQLHTYKKKNKGEKKYKIPEWQNNTKLSEKAVKWFEGRGISQFILRVMKIGEGVEKMPDKNTGKFMDKNTVQFPFIRMGEVINVQYRSADKNFKMYKDAEKVTYNIDNAYGQKTIYCVEGMMDVLAVMECGIHNVISPPNGFTEKGNVNMDWIECDVETFNDAEKLVLCFDNDIPGENGKNEFIRRFGAHRCFTVDLKGCKDANDYLVKYGGESLKTALENHKELPLNHVVTYNDIKNNVREFFINGMPKGLVTDTFKSLDKDFSVNFSHIVLVTGSPSSGKSEVVDQVVASYAVKYGYKTAFASPENKPNELHAQKLIRKINGRKPKTAQDFDMKFEACEDFLERHFYFIDLDGYDLESVISKAEELIYRRGIRILVIDPFNKVQYKNKISSVTGNRINDYTNNYLTILNNFASKYDMLVFLVAHPNKMEKGSNGKRVVPDFYDVKGGGEFYDMCHHGLVVHRDYDRELTLIKTLKVKFLHLGESNKESWYKYNINNGRLGDVEGDVDDYKNVKYEFDNSNWVTDSFKEPEQKDMFVPEIDDSLQPPSEDDWLNGGGDDTPF